MNLALANVFLANLSTAICGTYKPTWLKNPNTVFLHMFDWFIKKYGKTTTKDHESKTAADVRQMASHQWLQAPCNTTHLFIGTSYTSATQYPMGDCNVIGIGLRVIKHCGMYSEEYKNWLARKNKSPPINKTINSFKEYWSGAIGLVNQTAALALQHSYSMAVVDNDTSIALYNETLTNLDATYTATQETIKSQATSLAAMQGQLANIQQFCMTVDQQPPTSTPLPSTNAHPTTTAAVAMAEVKAAVVPAEATNNQPGMVFGGAGTP